MYERYFKRILDFVMALLALIILGPVMLIIAILVRLKLGSPVIFAQPRPGLHKLMAGMTPLGKKDSDMILSMLKIFLFSWT